MGKTEGKEPEEVIEKEVVEEPKPEEPEPVKEEEPEPVKEEEPKLDVDESGVSWRNRAMEAQRKLRDLEKNQAHHEPVDIDKFYEQEEIRTGISGATLRQMDERARRQAQTILQEEESVDIYSEEVLTDLAEKYPSINRYKNAIKSKLKGFSIESRKNPILIEEIAFSVLGREATNQPKKPVTTVKSAVLEPKGSSGRETVTLTEQEKIFADEHKLFDKEFSDKEIRELYNRKIKK